MRAVIIDDEIGAQEVLESIINRFAKDVTIVGRAGNLLDGVALIRKHRPHVVFLDVQMPNYYGFEIDRFFDEITFHIIFITAHDEYAVRAFELAALDYLLKPIEIPRFLEAMTRLRASDNALRAKHRLQMVQENYQNDIPTRITLLDKGFEVPVDVNDIVAIEGQSSYSNVYLINGKNYTQSKNLKQMGRLLEDHPNFYRSHRSWMINRQHLIDFSRSKKLVRMTSGIEAKVSREKMDPFLSWLKT